MNPVVLAAAVPIIVGLVGVFTQIGMPTKFAPLLCVIFGVAVVVLLAGGQFSLAIVLTGIVTGLAANGGHENVKVTAGAIKDAFSSK